MKSDARLLMPIVRIGKNGLTPGVIEEIKVHLKKRKLIKVRALRSALMDKERGYIKALASEMAEKTGSDVIQVIGFNIVLKKAEQAHLAGAKTKEI